MPDYSDIYAHILRQKQAIARRDRRAMRELTRRWMQVDASLSDQLTLLAQEAQAAHEAGTVPAALRWKLRRFESLQRQLYSELDSYGMYFAGLTTENQAAMAELAGVHFEEQLRRMGVLPSAFNRLPVAAFEAMVGNVVSGAPLYDYFMLGLPQETVEAISDALTRGIALGYNPRKTARLMRDAAALGHKRALLISRTETLRAYRQSTQMNYRQSKVVVGWKWLASKSTRTCMACLAKDGTVHDLDEEFVDHPRGRCTCVPVIPGRPIDWESGQDWFKKQPEGVQRKMLGDKKYNAWKDNKITLDDMANAHYHPTFGTHYGESSLAQAIQNAIARRQNQ